MSFYDDASLVFLAGGAAGKDGKVYNLKPVEELGSNLLSNGSFDGKGDWSFTNVGGTHGWRISGNAATGGTAICDDNADTANRNLVSTLSLTSGKSYRLRLDILQSEDNMSVLVGGTTLPTTLPTGTNLGYNYDIPASAHSGGILSIYAGTSDLQEIDNISVKEIVAAPADFTFTRGTNLTATRVGKDGYIEKGRENLLKYSNTFNQTGNALTGWSLIANNSGTAPTVTSGQSGYDGSTNAWLLDSENEVNNYCRLEQNPTYSGVFTFSIYAKSGTADFLVFENGGIANDQVYFDLASGEIESEGSAVIDAKITAITGSAGDTNRWYRCSVTLSGTSSAQRVYASTSGTDVNSGTAGNIYIQDAQLEAGLVATDYIETGATTATAGLLEDEPRFDYTGGGCPALLMEPARTNLVKNSEYLGDYSTSNATITTNALTSPEGLDNATTIDVTSNSGSAYAQSGGQVESVTAETEYTFSFYVKQGTNTENYLAVRDQNAEVFISEDVAYTASSSEWTRVEHTFTTPAGCISVRIYPQRYSSGGQGTTHIWGMQLEEGSFATSYIPTYGAAATREDENPIVSSAEDIIDITQGTLFIDATIDSNVDTPLYLMKFDGVNFNDTIYFYRSEIGKISGIYRIGGSAYGQQTTSAISGRLKAVFAYDSSNECTLYVNGSKVGSSFSIPTPSVNLTAIRLGGFNDTLAKQSGLTHQSLYFPTVLSNNDCEILTGAPSYRSFNVMRSALNYTAYE